MSASHYRGAYGALLVSVLILITAYGVFFAWLRHPPLAVGPTYSASGLTIGFRAPREYQRPDSSLLQGTTAEFSFPLKSRPEGCERWYGTVIVEYPSPDGTTLDLHRFLVRFKYDLPRERCLSDELVIIKERKPTRILFQQMLSTYTSSLLRDEPWGSPFELLLEKGEIRALPSLVHGKEFPFLGDHDERGDHQFSVSQNDFSVTPIVSPHDSLQKVLLNKIELQIQRCRDSRICPLLTMVVARIEDATIIEALQRASDTGIPLLLIHNYTEEPKLITSFSDYFAKDLRVSGWMWLQGNPYTIPTKLPMHLKYSIFGDDNVVSSNGNYDFATYYRSREIALDYRGKRVADIFNEITTMVRTGYLYSVAVDTSDELQILFNANRPRSFSPIRRVTSVLTKTPEGETTSYGALYRLLENNKSHLKLFMSPLTSSCARYGRRRCLFPILARYAEEGRLELTLNAYFYLPMDTLTYLASSGEDLYWGPQFVKEAVPLEKYSLLLKELPIDPSSLHFKMDLGWVHSNHHERYGILGDNYLLAGSSNYATPASYNTMEIVRSPELVRTLAAESGTVNEPYFVVAKTDLSKAYRTYGNCEFIFEFDLNHGPQISEGKVKIRELRDELFEKFGISKTADIRAIRPRDLTSIYKNETPPLQIEFDEIPLGHEDSFDNYSSYHCIKDMESGETFVTRSYRDTALIPR